MNFSMSKKVLLLMALTLSTVTPSFVNPEIRSPITGDMGNGSEGSIHSALKRAACTINRIDPENVQVVPELHPIPGATRTGSPFGWRNHPILKTRKKHKGQDFPAKVGTPVLATADGKVILASLSTGGYGNRVMIHHDKTYESLYAHLQKMYVEEGDIVSVGDTIGLSGNTGRSTNPHLHFEILKDGKAVNPMTVLNL